MRISDSLLEQRHVQGEVHPRVWLIVGDKPGDNAQAERLTQALGWPYERKQLQILEPYRIGKPRFEASLCHLDMTRSAPLKPPWPDLIITMGRRPAMAALWIREQSGGRTKIVLLSKPTAMLERFDLVVVGAAYRLPQRPNILPLELPLIRANETAMATAADRWRSRLSGLPRPLVALLVGGPTYPFIFDVAVATRLIDLASQMVRQTAGTLYITTSRRTPPAVVAALRAGLPPGGQLYDWAENTTDNPYLGLLGLADSFIVTGDSMSMMVEVARLGKRLAIFPLPTRPLTRSQHLRRFLARMLYPSAADAFHNRYLYRLGSLCYRLGLLGSSRDLTALHHVLIKRQLAVLLGEDFPTPGQQAPDELPLVVARVKRLMNDHPRGT